MLATPITYTCARCRQVQPVRRDDHFGNYGQRKDGSLICFLCCGEEDRERVHATREGKKVVLYLTHEGGCWRVQNWPGTLSYAVTETRKSRACVGGKRWVTRQDVWFEDGTGARWHGKVIGDNTQLCHCRKLQGGE